MRAKGLIFQHINFWGTHLNQSDNKLVVSVTEPHVSAVAQIHILY